MAKKDAPARADGRTARGTFDKGSAGNATGRAAIPAHKKSGLKRSDGWTNFFTGQGVAGQDKRGGGFFKADILTFDQMMELAIGDDIAKRACNTIPNEALRQGWDLTISEGASNKIDIAPKGPGAVPAPGAAAPGGAKPNPFAKKDGSERMDLFGAKTAPVPGTSPSPAPGTPPKTINKPDNDPTKSTAAQSEDDRIKEIMDKFTALGGEDAIKVCLTWERVFGGAVCVLGVNDGQGDLTQPLNMEKVKSIDYILPLEPREICPVYGYTDMFSENYGKPEIYRATPTSIWPGKNGGTGSAMFEIHESRLLVFGGEKVSRYQQIYAQNGWGMSIFVPMYRVLRDFNASWAAAGNIVTDFASAVYKFKDLWETLGGDDGEQFQARLLAMNISRSTINATVIDAEDEFERSSTSVGGLSDLLNQFATRLAAACDMPLTLLFGTSPGGLNATGDSDIRFFYDRVAQYQRSRVLRPLKKLLEIVMLCTGDKKIPDKWDVDFRPLWQESAKDKATTMQTQSAADVAWITAGVLSAEEVAAGHWSTGKYQPDITVDFAAREKQEQAAAAPVSQSDLNAINPDHPDYKGSRLDPNSSHYVEPPNGLGFPGAQPKPNPFAKMDANVARRRAYRAGVRPSEDGTRNDYSPDQERDERGRFGAEALAKSAKEKGGFTYDPHTGEHPLAGYSVAIHGDRERKLVGKEASTADTISNYIKDNHDVLLRDPKAHIGGWYNDKDDTWYLDVPHVENDLSKAASLGHDNKQLGIYDLKRGETIESKDYEDAISKQGRFEGRTDAYYGPAQNDARTDGRSYEKGAGENQERERSSRGLAWTAREKFARDLGRSDYSPDQERDHGRFSGNGSASSIKEAEARITGAGSSHVAVAPNTRPSFGLQNIASHMGNAYRGTDDGKKTQENWKGKASAFTSTQAAFKNGDKYDADRKEIHDKYVSDVNKDVPVSKEQTVWMTGGGPASGKTSGLLRNENAAMPTRESDKEGTDSPHFPSAVFVSADEAKERIPEYQAGLKAKDPNAAGFVHDETSDMTKVALSKAIATHKDIVYDSTGDSGIDALTAKVNGMRAMGVKKVNASYATLDTDVAQKRSNIRGAQTGRFVPHDVLVANHKEVSKTMIQAMDRGLFDHQQIWDTSGRKPELVASSSREHGVSVVNPTLWNNLQKRAGLDK